MKLQSGQVNSPLAKLLLENQDLLLIILAIGLVWYIVLANVYASKKSSKGLDLIIFSIVLAFVFESYPLELFSPQHLIGGHTTLIKISVRLIFYSACFILFRAWFSGLGKNVILLFQEPFLAGLLFWTVISFSWSETPLITFRTALVAIGLGGLAAHVAVRYRWHQMDTALRWTILVCGVITIFASLLQTRLPGSIGVGEVNVGGALSNKGMATLLSLGAALWTAQVLEYPKHRWLSISGALISFGAIFFMNSVSSVFTAITCIYLIFLLNIIKRFNPKQVPLVLWFVLAVGLISGLIFQLYSAEIFAFFGKAPHLSGRSSIWPAIWNDITKKLWTGYGYMGYWQEWRNELDPSLGLQSPVEVRHAHNGILELGLQLGVIGIVLYVFTSFVAIFAAAKHFFRQRSLHVACMPLVLLVFLNLSCFAETFRLGMVGPNFIWFIFAMVQVRLIADSRERTAQNIR